MDDKKMNMTRREGKIIGLIPVKNIMNRKILFSALKLFTHDKI